METFNCVTIGGLYTRHRGESFFGILVQTHTLTYIYTHIHTHTLRHTTGDKKRGNGGN